MDNTMVVESFSIDLETGDTITLHDSDTRDYSKVIGNHSSTDKGSNSNKLRFTPKTKLNIRETVEKYKYKFKKHKVEKNEKKRQEYEKMRENISIGLKNYQNIPKNLMKKYDKKIKGLSIKITKLNKKIDKGNKKIAEWARVGQSSGPYRKPLKVAESGVNNSKETSSIWDQYYQALDKIEEMKDKEASQIIAEKRGENNSNNVDIVGGVSAEDIHNAVTEAFNEPNQNANNDILNQTNPILGIDDNLHKDNYSKFNNPGAGSYWEDVGKNEFSNNEVSSPATVYDEQNYNSDIKNGNEVVADIPYVEVESNIDNNSSIDYTKDSPFEWIDDVATFKEAEQNINEKNGSVSVNEEDNPIDFQELNKIAIEQLEVVLANEEEVAKKEKEAARLAREAEDAVKLKQEAFDSVKQKLKEMKEQAKELIIKRDQLDKAMQKSKGVRQKELAHAKALNELVATLEGHTNSSKPKTK